MKLFNKPVVEVMAFEVEDVITVSGIEEGNPEENETGRQ